MLDVLGLDPLDPQWADSDQDDDQTLQSLEALVSAQLQEREKARAARDFSRADSIRYQLEEAGISIADTPSGSTWSLNR